MIRIFHGTDLKASRNAFIDIRNARSETSCLDGGKIDLVSVRQALEGGGLFGSQPTLVIEELFSKKKTSKELDTVAQYLAEHQDADVLLWESKELTPKQLASFPKAKVGKYNLPSSLFAFLDSVKPGNAKEMLTLFHEVLQTQEAELVFFMLVRQVRILLALSDPGTEQIEEVAKLQSWQKGKLMKQAQSSGKEKLLSLFSELFATEYAMKTGGLTQPLENRIDMLLATI